MAEYYRAYDKRYRQVHELGLSWASHCPSPVLAEIMDRYGISKSSSLLELGCGEGRDAAALLKNGFALLATDVSPAAIEYCRKLVPEYAQRFCELDACAGTLEGKFDFIYAIAVLHMLTRDEHRRQFLRFIHAHLSPGGIALVSTQGDGEREYCSDEAAAFENAQRRHEETGRIINIASTSFRMVSFTTLETELAQAGFEIAEKGMTSVEPDFPVMMYAVIRKADL